MPGEHDATPVDIGHALPVGQRMMLQAGFVVDVLSGRLQLTSA